jgi:hypothetical protein
MLTDVFAALVLLVCLLWLVHGWLPLALQQRINHALFRLQLGLRQLPAWWRGRRASRQARAEAQGLIDRARRDRPAGGGQVHDLAQFRRRREAENDLQQPRH